MSQIQILEGLGRYADPPNDTTANRWGFDTVYPQSNQPNPMFASGSMDGLLDLMPVKLPWWGWALVGVAAVAAWKSESIKKAFK